MKRLVSLLLSAAAATAQTGGHSSNDLEHLSRREADAVVRRDLLSILEPVTPPRHGMFRRVRAAQFMTRAYATGYRGVCGRDSVTLWYGASADQANSADVPLAPYSITAGSSFHIERLADTTVETEEPGRPEVADACARVAHAEKGWFAAPSANTAVDGAQALAATQAAIAAGKLKPDCAGTTACAARIVAADRLGLLSSVEPCETQSEPACYHLSFDDSMELTIVVEPNYRSTVPAVKSVRYGEFVIVT